MTPEVIVAGERLSTLMPWGDLEWVTCMPGGTESITFDVTRNRRTFRPGALVEVDYGGLRLACGLLTEPSRGAPLVAEGLFRKGEDFTALVNNTGEVAPGVNSAVNDAIVRGMPWIHAGAGDPTGDLAPQPTVSDVPKLDLTQPHSVAQYLDASAQQRGQLWWVDANRVVRMTAWPTVATYHLRSGIDGLGISRDGYASTLIARYNDVGTGTYRTATAHDEAATERWGYVERTLTAPLAEGAPITAAAATALLEGLLLQGQSQIGWTKPITVEFGDVVTAHDKPVDINRLRAGEVLKVHGLEHDAADLDGGTTAHLPYARTRHQGTTVQIEPLGLSSPMNDALAGVAA